MKRTSTAKWNGSRWRIDVQKDGQRKTFVSSTPGRAGQREANAKADAWLDDGISLNNMTVQDAYIMFLEDVKLRSSSGNYRNEESRWRILIQPVIGRDKISSLSDGRLQYVIDKAYKKNKEPLSRKYLLSLRASLVAFCKYLRKHRMSSYLPEDITIPKGSVVKEKTILQPEQVKTFLTVDTTIDHGKRVFDRFIYAYRFQFFKGLRPGEMRGIMWSDISGNILHLQRSVNVSNEITTGKNKNAKRSIFLTESDLALLEHQKQLKSNSVYVFGVDHYNTYSHCWNRYCRSNGIPEISPYELRHSFVSLAKMLPDGLMKPVIGHSKDMDTWGTYGHELNGDLEKAATLFEKTVSNIINPPEKIEDKA